MSDSNLIGGMIAASTRLGLGYADRLMSGLTNENYARFAKSGEGVIESNHPAFVCGHLSLYPPVILQQLGFAAQPIPDGFESVFSKDATCVDDPNGTIYPPMDLITETLYTGYRTVVDALDKSDDGLFADENPNEAMRSRFPTKGAALGFYVGGHFMMHMGQLSAWRRAMGMGPA